LHAYHYEDIVDATNAGRAVITWSFGSPSSSPSTYYWHTWYKPYLYRIVALGAVLLSVLCLIGIFGTLDGVGSNSSPFFLITHPNDVSGVNLCIFIFITLSYSTLVVLWSVLQMRVAGIIELLPYQSTSPLSMSLNCRVCISLAPALAFFYLGWIYENGVKHGGWEEGVEGGNAGEGEKNKIYTAFSSFYDIGLIPFIGMRYNELYYIYYRDR
jgi:hypothetical protein